MSRRYNTHECSPLSDETKQRLTLKFWVDSFIQDADPGNQNAARQLQLFLEYGNPLLFAEYMQDFDAFHSGVLKDPYAGQVEDNIAA